MACYVLALTDRQLPPTTIGGRRCETVRAGRVFAVVQRRAQAPSRDDAELRRQFRTVVELTARLETILPVRFGTLMNRRELDAVLRQQQGDLLRALDDVRGRVQMTVRILGRGPRVFHPQPAATSGREYLERKRRAGTVDLPGPTVRLLARLGPFVARERQLPGSGQLLATVYHLVDAASVERYLAVACRQAHSSLLVTGPFPPYAFAPEVG